MKKILFFSLLLFVILAAFVSAHQPRIVQDNSVTVIQNPEVSQAFYGSLAGKPSYFIINSDSNFELYAGVLVPDLKNFDKDISAEIIYNNKTFFVLDGLNYNWTYLYEEFAGDSYYSGPDKKVPAEKGTYLIKVFSTDNYGKYVLVVGEKEEFPPKETLRTVITLPGLKKNFFEKSPFTAFFNIVGLFLLGFIILVLVVVLVVYLILKMIFRRKKNKEKKKLRK
jgi:hypothetical protein